jgi:protein required for attachment to host cells
MTFTFATLQPLLEQFKGEGPVVSCYADLSGVPGLVARWPEAFKAKLSTIKELFIDDPRTWKQCERNLQAIGHALTGPEVGPARGMAVFAALQRDFFHCCALDVPVENELVVHPAPYLVPLLVALLRQRELLLVHTDTHRGRLYAATPGGVRLLQEIEEEVPSRQRSSGERWGMEQATIARHREDRILHYQKELVGLIEKAWADHLFQGIVLLGEHEVLEHVRKRLRPRLASQVVHEGPHGWPDRPLAVAEAVQATLAEVEESRERRLLESVEERLGQGRAIAAGPREVVAALQSGQIGPHGHGSLVLGPDPRESVRRCTTCRALYVDMPATCPRCQAPCVDGNLWEEVLLLALRHDVTAHCVKRNEALSRYGGMAALLAVESSAKHARGDNP